MQNDIELVTSRAICHFKKLCTDRKKQTIKSAKFVKLTEAQKNIKYAHVLPRARVDCCVPLISARACYNCAERSSEQLVPVWLQEKDRGMD